MSTEIVAIMLGAALMHALWNSVVKSGGNKLFEVTLVAGGSSVIAALALPFLPVPAPAAWPLLAISTLIHLFYNISIAAAYKRVDLSFGYTIMRGCAPMLTAIALCLLGTPLSPGGACGVLMLCAGVLTLTWDNLHIRKDKPTRPGDLAVVFGTAFIIMGYTLADGYGARFSGHAIAYVSWIFFLEGLPLAGYALTCRRRDFIPYARRRLAVVFGGSLCNVGSYGIAIWAMTKAPIALVAALRETSVIFGMLIGVLFLHERFTPARAVAVLMVAAGTMIMRLV